MSCSEALVFVGSLLAAAAAPLARACGWLLSCPSSKATCGEGEMGRKRRLHLGPTALGLAYGRPVRGRFIRFTPSRPTLQFRLNPFVAVILGSFVSPLINHRGLGTGVMQTAWGLC